MWTTSAYERRARVLILHRSSFIELAVLWTLVVGCGKDREARPVASEGPSTAATVPTPDSAGTRVAGPSIVVDSTASEVWLERTRTGFFLHLPRQMATRLNDALPGFSPFPQAYWRPFRDASDTAYSAVIGDFDGDSRKDVAMVGTSKSVPAFFILLADSGATGKPGIVFVEPATDPNSRPYRLSLVHPQKIRNPDDVKDSLNLRTDAIHLQSGEIAEICYLEQGALRVFGLSGD
jgi:hypothetical protein